MIHTIELYYCECCGNTWEDNDDTLYVKCTMCGAKELRSIANKKMKW